MKLQGGMSQEESLSQFYPTEGAIREQVRDRRLLFWAATTTRFIFEICVLKHTGNVSSACFLRFDVEFGS